MHPTPDDDLHPAPAPTTPLADEVRNEQKNDDPSTQQRLTGESVTAPDDTKGG